MGLKYGIDVSYCQANLNWSKLRDTNPDIKFAIIRTGYSYGDKYIDTQFLRHVKGCKENGIDIYGVYHFSYALSEADAVKEAIWCVKQLDQANLPNTTPVFFDFEYASEDFCKQHYVTCDTDFIRKVTQAFCNEIQKAGYTPGIYLNVDYFNRMYKGWLPYGAKVWAAKWVNYSGGKVSPIDDTTLSNINKQPPFGFDVWQYGAVNVPGVGVVDADVIFTPDEEVKMESKKSNEEIAAEVVRGEWGNGAERRYRLEEAGYDYRAVQSIVNTYYE